MRDDRLDQMDAIALALPSEYSLADQAWRSVDAPMAVPLGFGGSSIVVRALYRDQLRRAVKVYLPRSDLRSQLDMSQFVNSYENELLRQASLSHQNISKVTDFATISVGGSVIPMLATEFIDGESLTHYARRADTSGQDLLRILTDVLRGMQYLHDNQVMHCDIKP